MSGAPVSTYVQMIRDTLEMEDTMTGFRMY